MRGFLTWTALLLVLLSGASLTRAQTATDLNEGLQLAASTTAGDFTLTWWGKTGRTYFVQQSADLVSWQYVPVVQGGTSTVCGVNFSSSEARLFWRLVYTNSPIPVGLTASTADFDGDGLSNHDEVYATVATSPFLRDTDWDGFTDAAEIIAGTNPSSPTSSPGATAPLSGPLNPDASYRNGLRLSFGQKNLYAYTDHDNHPTLTTPTWESGASAREVTASGPNIFHDPEPSTTEDLIPEAVGIYESKSFTRDRYMFPVPKSLYTMAEFESKSSTKSGSTVVRFVTNLQRFQFEVKAERSPGAPEGTTRTLTAFFYEGGSVPAKLKEAGTITFTENNVEPSSKMAPHCTISGNTVIIEPKLKEVGDLTDKNPDPETTDTLQNYYLRLMDVSIEPASGMAGVLGDVIKSAKKDSRVRHFVTPQVSAELSQGDVEFEAQGVPDDNPYVTVFDDLFEWEGGEPGLDGRRPDHSETQNEERPRGGR